MAGMLVHRLRPVNPQPFAHKRALVHASRGVGMLSPCTVGHMIHSPQHTTRSNTMALVLIACCITGWYISRPIVRLLGL